MVPSDTDFSLALDDANPPESHYIESLNSKIHYLDWGNSKAPTLVFVHGVRDHGRAWDFFASKLREGFHVVCIDLRGHGDSGHTVGTYGTEEFLFDLNVLVDHLQGPVYMVGHSLGGALALRYTGVFPEKVKKLVTIEAGQPAPEKYVEYHSRTPVERMRHFLEGLGNVYSRVPRTYETLGAAVERFVKENARLRPEIARHLAKHAVKQNEDGSFSWKFDRGLHVLRQDTFNEDRFDYWTKINCPVLMMFGSDSFVPGLDKTGLSRIIAEAQVKKFEGLGHWLHHEEPELVLECLIEFL